MYLHPSNNPATVRRTAVLPLLLALTIICLTPLFVRVGFIPGSVEFQPAPAVQQDFGRMPLLFVENRGQLDPQVAYYVQGRDKTIYFTPDGITFALTSPAVAPNRPHDPWALRAAERAEPPAPARWVIRQEFVGATPGIRPVGQEQAEALISYFTGPVEQHQTGLRTYQRLVYPNLWPGIDLVYAGTVNRMKYEFIVQPGANPAAIRLAYHGATDVQVTADGQLEVITPLGNLTDAAPLAYQEINGARVPVSMAYALDDAAAGQPHSYGFTLGAYDPAYPLVLDPAILVYAGYIGDTWKDAGYDIAVDDDGNAYVTGYVQWPATQSTFPATVGPDLTYNGDINDAFVAKLNADGTALIYAGFIGGADQDIGYGIAVDSAGNAYVTGETRSEETSFPVKIGPDLIYNDTQPGLPFDAFVAKVSADGTELVYAGYISSQSISIASDIAVDSAGNAYITGDSGPWMPVANGSELTYNGEGDAFVAKVRADGAGLVYTAYIGGTQSDLGRDIAVDAAGHAYIVGETMSSDMNITNTVGFDSSYNGGISDAFVAKVNPDGTALVYAAYLGGIGRDGGYGIAVDADGQAVITGLTESDETTFPVLTGPDLSYNGGVLDAFVARVNADGTALVHAGYIGGADADYGGDIAVDRLGNAYIVGETWSDETSFPVLLGPDLTHNDNTGDSYRGDAFVAQVNPGGTALVYAGYVGGAEHDGGFGIAVDWLGNVYMTGETRSDETSFPVQGAFGPTHYSPSPSMEDAFVAKVSASYTLSSITGRVANTNNVPLAGVTLTASDGGRTTTDASGIYTLTGVLSGTTTLTPTLSGYTFVPVTRTVSTPPEATGQDFTAANRPPIAVDDSAAGMEDMPLIIDVTANDSDPDAGDTIGVVLVGTPVHGSVAISGATQLIYTPTLNFAGSDVLTYTVSDGELRSTASVSITILPVNDPPVVTSTNALTITVHTGSGPINVLIGDPDDPPGGLTVTVESSNPALVPPANIVLSGSGTQRTLTITPAVGQIGVTQITITVRDSGGRSAQAMLRFTVTGFRQYLPLIRKQIDSR